MDENQKDLNVEKEESQIKISNDTIATYAGIAVSEVNGVYGMTGTFAGITEAISGKKNFAKGIKVDVDENKVKIDVNIIVEYGARIPDVAYEIQNRVKKAIENMTGLSIDEVNVHIQGVNIDMQKNQNHEDDKKE